MLSLPPAGGRTRRKANRWTAFALGQRTDDLAAGGDDALAFPNHGDHWARAHVLHQASKERPEQG